MSEAGDPTPKYYSIRQLIYELTGGPLLPVPPPTQKIAYGSVSMMNLGSIAYLMDLFAIKTVEAVYPLSFEQLDQAYGFVMYETTIPLDGSLLNVPGLKDRGHVMLDGELWGILELQAKIFSLNAQFKQGQRLQILVESQGRRGDGSSDFKGIIENVTLDERILTAWTITTLDFGNLFVVLENRGSEWAQSLQKQSLRHETENFFAPSIFYGSFAADQLADTYFDPTGWSKGQLFINANNLGRYWPARGPQVFIYLQHLLISWKIIFLLEQF